MQHPLLLSTGEFAQMCNVSRELLVHYDKIGLLKPKEVRGNGYRYYSLKQLYLFDVVRFFMDAGMSTKEIKVTWTTARPNCSWTASRRASTAWGSSATSWTPASA